VSARCRYCGVDIEYIEIEEDGTVVESFWVCLQAGTEDICDDSPDEDHAPPPPPPEAAS